MGYTLFGVTALNGVQDLLREVGVPLAVSAALGGLVLGIRGWLLTTGGLWDSLARQVSVWLFGASLLCAVPASAPIWLG